jgi:hypothetical protein
MKKILSHFHCRDDTRGRLALLDFAVNSPATKKWIILLLFNHFGLQLFVATT